MSSMELNKGKLVPVDWDAIVEEHPNADLNDFHFSTNGKFLVIEDTYYRNIPEIDAEKDFTNFALVNKNEDGSIEYFTHHYNGGAALEEVIEQELTK